MLTLERCSSTRQNDLYVRRGNNIYTHTAA